MRMNLDPLEQYKDEAVWSALEQVTHTDPLFDKRYCPVNNSSRPEEGRKCEKFRLMDRIEKYLTG